MAPRAAGPCCWWRIAALGAMLTDLRSANGQAIGVSWTQLVFTAILFVLWLMLTRPVASAGRAPRHSSGMAPQERQQLAQELHDGVGSQLTTIISALDHGSPQERATAAALQEALIDLKLLVDGVDEEASVVSLLANLRYRTRPLLEAAGIELGWHVADEALLEQVQGPPAREILRIAQECLANVVHHSGGDAVTVTLCHMKAQDALWLEIADNGRGIGPSPDVEPEDAAPAAWPPGRPGGKGLPGMRRRAQQLGGQLDVHSVPGEGTRVTLQVPLERLVAETEA
jgi:signal transduction histidine kinase